VNFSDELYENVANLSLEKDTVRRFADENGTLRRESTHFHPTDKGQALKGEPWHEWRIELTRFQLAVTVWYRIKDRNLKWIKRFLEPLQKPGAAWLLQPPHGADWNKPLDFARSMILRTINHQLAGGTNAGRKCAVLGCGFTSPPHSHSHTRALVRPGRRELPELTIVSTDLLKAIWLQFAEDVCGQRKMKRCAARDCGKYMDVTKSERPGARRMHSRCEERIRKQNYRKRKKEQ
jgi:hypothetical protein